jgi:O-antigen/teichoic acid export membrane protein
VAIEAGLNPGPPEGGPPASGATAGAPRDPGAIRNTLLQLASQAAGLVFTGGLTLYLVRALGASGYGVYALAVSIGGLVLYPAGLGLPWSVGRFLADHRDDVGQLRAILLLGIKLQAAASLVASVGLFVLAGPVADAFGNPHLGWPLRWMAVSLIGQAMFGFLTSAVTSVRRVSTALWMAIIESAGETATAAGLVLAGAGAAGAVLGKAVGYSLAAVAGLYLTSRLVAGLRSGVPAKLSVGARSIMRYAGAMLIVDVTWSAIAQIDVILVGAMLTSAAVGSFGAVLRILMVLGSLGLAVSSGVAPRLSLQGGKPDTRAFVQGIRYLTMVQGLVIAPLLVWAHPIVELLLGSGYPSAPGILRVLTVQAFVSAPAVLISVAVTYLGEARRRVPIVLVTLVLGLIVTYVLIRAVGVLGAAIGDDVVQVVYIAAHLWICSRLITVDLRTLGFSCLRTLAAAAVMTLPLLAFGTDHLSVAGWIAGLVLGGLVYLIMLLVTRELAVGELQSLAGWLRRRLRGQLA